MTFQRADLLPLCRPLPVRKHIVLMGALFSQSASGWAFHFGGKAVYQALAGPC